MRARLLSASAVLMSIANLANAAADEHSKILWSCKTLFGTENVLWLAEWGSKSYVKVFDERIPAELSLDGLEKRWDWGFDSSDSSYNYAVALDSNRTAAYYDFRQSKDGTAEARQFYKCTKWSKEVEEEEEHGQAEEAARAVAQRSDHIKRMIDEYVLYIQEKVQRSWVRPPSGGSELSCTVEIRLIPSGEVIDAKIVRSSGDVRFDRSVEAAVFKASPLPVPPDPNVMEQFRVLRFAFMPG